MILSLNDDRLIMEFLSGRYTGAPQGYGIHIKYPLSWFIAMLYKMAPQFDWYGYTMLGLMLLSVLLVLGRIFRLTEGKQKKSVMFVSVLAITLFAVGEQFVSITYSTVAAIMGAAILFLYGTTDGRKSDILVLGLLSAATWCLRYHLFYMILPAAGLIWLYRDFFSKKKLLQKFAVPLTVLFFVGGSMLFNFAMYSSPEWQEFEAFNDSRITIYDNPNDYYFPPYEEKTQYYEDLGIKKVEQHLMVYYGLLLGRDEIPTDTFHKMVETRKNYGDNESEWLSTRIFEGTKCFAKRILTGEYGALFYVSVAGFGFLLLLLLWKREWQELLKIAIFFAGLMVIFWAMEMNGRMPERVIYSLSIMLFLCMLVSMFWEKDLLPGSMAWKSVKLIITAGLAVIGLVNIFTAFQDNKEAVSANHEKEAVVQYCNDHPENFYYISTGYLCTTGYNFYFGAVDNSQMNYMSTGDWVSYSPLQQERLEQEGWQSAVESLLLGENIYLISREDRYQAYFRDYLEYRCGKLVLPVVEDTIQNDIHIYRFKVREEPPSMEY